MIDTATVLILGAGASYPYGFPVAQGLQDEVVKVLDAGEEYREIVVALEELGFSKSDMSQFRNALKKADSGSVDYFLSGENGRKFQDLGKMQMAGVLIRKEKWDSLQTIISTKRETHWYQLLWDKIKDTCDDLGKNNLSILTFNYDRSLEKYLLETLMAYTGKKQPECEENLKKIPIIHLYGTIGDFWSNSDKFRPYGPQITKEILKKCADQIMIVNHGDSADALPQFIEAKKIFKNAGKICFLGFSYYPENMKRLGIREWKHFNPSPAIYGSTFGLTDGETHNIRRNFRSNAQTLGHKKCDCRAYLRETDFFHVSN